MRKSLLGRGLESTLMARDLRRMSKATDEQDRERARQLLATRMGKLRGLPQKLGQSMSLLADDNTAGDFESLSEGGTAMPFAEVAAILEQAWGKPVSHVLEHLDQEGLAASLGQVHRGCLPDGREVAVKVAYPGIREAVLNDLQMLGWLGKPAERFIGGFEFDAYRTVILSDLEEELDYQAELANQQHYDKWVNPRKDRICVPAVYPELSTSSVLVTGWEAGSPIKLVTAWPDQIRQQIGTALVKHFLHMFFNNGLVHADPHQGNYRFRVQSDGPAVVLYDYGALARFDKKTRLLILRLILATQNQAGDPLGILGALGFNEELLIPIRDKLPALCRVLFEPFVTEGKYDPKDWNRQERLGDILGEDRWNFRMSGPASYVFLIRGFQGLFYYLRKLNVTVSWNILLRPIMERNLAELLAQRVPAPANEAVRFENMAHYLQISVTESGTQKVGLKFPATSVERLEALMGDDISRKVRARGIDPDQVVRKARASGYAPAELFVLDDGPKKVRVWLA